MLRRIDWNAGREEEEEEEAEEGKPPRPPNYCHLVWQVRVFPAGRSFMRDFLLLQQCMPAPQCLKQVRLVHCLVAQPPLCVSTTFAGRGQGGRLPQVLQRDGAQRGGGPHFPAGAWAVLLLVKAAPAVARRRPCSLGL